MLSSQGFRIAGLLADSAFGISVSSAGNVNGDGYNDIIIGASAENGGTRAAYVVYGGPALASFTVSNSMSTNQGFKINGEFFRSYFGTSVSAAGDVGAQGSLVYIIFGGSALDSVTLSSNLGSAGYIITGPSGSTTFGRSINSTGDVNRDGYSDIIIGNYQESKSIGSAYVIFGGANLSNLTVSSMSSNQGFKISGLTNQSYFGYFVSSAMDMNNDGYDDILIGAFGESFSVGAAYIIFGGSALSNITVSKQYNA